MISGRICNKLVAETSVSISEARLRRSCSLNILSLASSNDKLWGVSLSRKAGKGGRSGSRTLFCRIMEVCVPD